MQSFQITNGPPPQGPKNYVFVDEHNRHKRLKVMRACEGCRRRKIKCDAATTNTWPCAACKRLKLPCVPPAGGLDFDQNSNEDLNIVQQMGKPVDQPVPISASVSVPYDTYPQFQVSQFPSVPAYGHENVQSSLIPDGHQYVPQHQLQDIRAMGDNYPQHLTQLETSGMNILTQSQSSPKSPETHTAETLSEQLGELRIGENGVAPYARQQTHDEPDGPIQESEIELPPLSTAAGSQIRIPPALMPDDDEAYKSFRVFFRDVHPYVPVLCRSQFYHQWKHDRMSLSPLLLEAIFACAGRVTGEPAEESPWLALANKHEASFLDTPRLSTVQALMLLMKAREASPKRGYFYKSWMVCKTALSMAKDLDLHEHHAIHGEGESCGSTPAECIVKTRIWQLISICEMMIGASQGRFDFGVDCDTIDLSPHPINCDIDEYESKISHQFSSFTNNALNIRRCAEGYVKVKRKKEWALDPIFDKLQADFHKWPQELPEDLQLELPPDGALPHLPSHFIGNMHSHHQLGIIMLHRPQIVALANKALFDTDQWRYNMSVCYQAAKRLCQLQEAILAQYDMVGLICMQRGMSYTIYAILTCIMLHLVAITSPDPEFNVDAREFFVRHMRLLEKCMPEWPMAETDKQINNLRAAFSANLERPFDLRSSFPYGSPSSTSSQLRRPSDDLRASYVQPSDQAFYQRQQQNYPQPPQTYFPTPPTSNMNNESKSPTPQFYPNYTMSEQHQAQFRHMGPTSFPHQNLQGPAWNPSPIIDSFNTAFAIPPSALQPPNPMYGSSPPISIPPSIPQQQQFTPSPQTPTYDLNAYARHQAQAQAEAQAMAQVQAAQVHQHQHPHPHPHQQAQSLMPSHQQFPPPQQPQPQRSSSYYDPNARPNSLQPIAMPPNYKVEAPNMQDQSPLTPQSGSQTQPPMPDMVYVSAKEWQQSVASVFDPGGVKRRWTFDTQIAQ